MIRLAILALMLAPLAACVTAPTARLATSATSATPAVPPVSAVLTARASLAIDELVRLNAAAQRAVAIFLPWLSPEQAARVRGAAALVDAAIGRVALARDLATQAAAITEAKAAIAGFKWLAGA